MQKIDRDLYTFYYNCEKITLQELIDMVAKMKISYQDFHWITGYSYEGIKNQGE